MKTAISIPDDVFKEVEQTAREYNYSRSELFTIAVKEFLEKIKSRKLLDALNDVYSEQETTEETALRQKSKRHYARRLLKEPY